MLQLEHIDWQTPNGTPILQDLSLVIPDGKLTVITGPNGGGKTTLAKIISGVELPSSGRILLDGQDITALDITQRAKLGISFAFQQPVRFKGITVRRLLELSCGGKVPESRLCDTLSATGLCAREYLDREVDATLSGGEIKRIEIATVIARHTRLSVFDEPEAGIDLWSFSNLIGVFKKLRGKLDGSMVIISHQERILKIADEIAVIADGGVQQSGSADEILPQILSGRDIHASCMKQEAMFHG